MNSMRCCGSLKQLNNGVITLGGKKVAGFGSFQCRSKFDKRGGCKEIDQLKDKKLVSWPCPDQHPSVTWQRGCPTECPTQQPPNYDPYKIKVPNVLVPPMPPGSAKDYKCEDAREILDAATSRQKIQDLFSNSAIVHPDYWKVKEKLPEPPSTPAPPRLGYHGRTKYLYAFHEPWKPLDRCAMLAQAEIEDTRVEASEAEDREVKT